ncbi:hypothetical protein I5907_18980 [Panacibacter sp. DH6]|uniref:Uncharacterized protein n=1 Tax=Panacibacter microcysteis TaxID=2793269 RepID=A0A931GZN9_9BACT|nr:hypothetical protein [Panacibacter microcysteis]MBG9378330.1 hypothetical protein [Panacibacter microcysteis]
MADSPQVQTIKSIADWSKWITGISMFSVSGCVGILVSKGVGTANIANIKLAIGFFLLTVLCSWFVQFFAAAFRQYQHGTANMNTEVILFSRTFSKQGFVVCVFAEVICFVVSLCFLFIWIWHVPAKP